MPTSGLLCDLLWSDADKRLTGWHRNIDRVSFKFGEKEVHEFLHNNNLSLICRGHQPVKNGYEFNFGDERFVTIFSAIDFLGDVKNFAALMNVDENLNYSFRVISN